MSSDDYDDELTIAKFYSSSLSKLMANFYMLIEENAYLKKKIINDKYSISYRLYSKALNDKSGIQIENISKHDKKKTNFHRKYGFNHKFIINNQYSTKVTDNYYIDIHMKKQLDKFGYFNQFQQPSTNIVEKKKIYDIHNLFNTKLKPTNEILKMNNVILTSDKSRKCRNRNIVCARFRNQNGISMFPNNYSNANIATNAKNHFYIFENSHINNPQINMEYELNSPLEIQTPLILSTNTNERDTYKLESVVSSTNFVEKAHYNEHNKNKSTKIMQLFRNKKSRNLNYCKNNVATHAMSCSKLFSNNELNGTDGKQIIRNTNFSDYTKKDQIKARCCNNSLTKNYANNSSETMLYSGTYNILKNHISMRPIALDIYRLSNQIKENESSIIIPYESNNMYAIGLCNNVKPISIECIKCRDANHTNSIKPLNDESMAMKITNERSIYIYDPNERYDVKQLELENKLINSDRAKSDFNYISQKSNIKIIKSNKLASETIDREEEKPTNSIAYIHANKSGDYIANNTERKFTNNVKNPDENIISQQNSSTIDQESSNCQIGKAKNELTKKEEVLVKKILVVKSIELNNKISKNYDIQSKIIKSKTKQITTLIKDDAMNMLVPNLQDRTCNKESSKYEKINQACDYIQQKKQCNKNLYNQNLQIPNIDSNVDQDKLKSEITKQYNKKYITLQPKTVLKKNSIESEKLYKINALISKQEEYEKQVISQLKSDIITPCEISTNLLLKDEVNTIVLKADKPANYLKDILYDNNQNNTNIKHNVIKTSTNIDAYDLIDNYAIKKINNINPEVYVKPHNIKSDVTKNNIINTKQLISKKVPHSNSPNIPILKLKDKLPSAKGIISKKFSIEHSNKQQNSSNDEIEEINDNNSNKINVHVNTKKVHTFSNDIPTKKSDLIENMELKEIEFNTNSSVIKETHVKSLHTNNLTTKINSNVKNTNFPVTANVSKFSYIAEKKNELGSIQKKNMFYEDYSVTELGPFITDTDKTRTEIQNNIVYDHKTNYYVNKNTNIEAFDQFKKTFNNTTTKKTIEQLNNTVKKKDVIVESEQQRLNISNHVKEALVENKLEISSETLLKEQQENLSKMAEFSKTSYNNSIELTHTNNKIKNDLNNKLKNIEIAHAISAISTDIGTSVSKEKSIGTKKDLSFVNKSKSTIKQTITKVSHHDTNRGEINRDSLKSMNNIHIGEKAKKILYAGERDDVITAKNNNLKLNLIDSKKSNAKTLLAAKKENVRLLAVNKSEQDIDDQSDFTSSIADSVSEVFSDISSINLGSIFSSFNWRAQDTVNKTKDETMKNNINQKAIKEEFVLQAKNNIIFSGDTSTIKSKATIRTVNNVVSNINKKVPMKKNTNNKINDLKKNIVIDSSSD